MQYIQIQTYAHCNEYLFTTVCKAYQMALQHLHCGDERVLDWLAQLRWPHNEDESFGDIYASPFTLMPDESSSIACEALDLSLFLHSSTFELEETRPWANFNLLFNANAIRTSTGKTYTQQAARQLWIIMRELANSFRELGVYLTDEWQEHRTWQTITQGFGDPWTFDLAIMPRSVAQEHFYQPPTSFCVYRQEHDMAFAQLDRWQILPWQEAQQPHTATTETGKSA